MLKEGPVHKTISQGLPQMPRRGSPPGEGLRHDKRLSRSGVSVLTGVHRAKSGRHLAPGDKALLL